MSTVAAAKKEWPCSACTFLNASHQPRCTMCYAHRPPRGTVLSPPPGTAGGRNGRSPVVVDLTGLSSSSKRALNGGEYRVASTESARSKRRRRNSEETGGWGGGEKAARVRRSSDSTHGNDVKARDRGNFSRGRERKTAIKGEHSSSSAPCSGSSSVPQHWLSGETSGGGGGESSRVAAAVGVSAGSSSKSWHGRNGVAVRDGDVPRGEGSFSSSSDRRAMSQSTLFGTIVKNIQTKELSSCSTRSSKHKSSKEVARREQWQQHDRSDERIDEPFSHKSGIVPTVGGCGTVTELLTPQPSSPLQSTDGADKNNSDERRFQSLWQKSQHIMKKTFQIPSLRKLQPAAVRGALRGRSQIIVMATGGGKSLCYQLPAAVLPGTAVVLSPLIALMVDQVRALNSKGVTAALVSSMNGERENMDVMQRLVGRKDDGTKNQSSGAGKNVSSGRVKPIKLLYCTPELVETTRFRAVLSDLYKQGKLSLFAIDEAHCLSTWGHDFRPAYRKLSWVRANFPEVPCMACTATATPKVIQDIRDNLLMKEDEVPCHLSSFNRANISYEVRYKDALDTSPRGSLTDLIKVVKEQHDLATKAGVPCSGIIYVHKRNDTATLARQIFQATGIKSAAYHAGLKDSLRKDTQQKWTDGSIQLAVATVAFGMGIDLPHVRYVVHWAMAKSVEGFYQESGRAGRDGKPAVSVLYYSKDDASKFSFLIKKTSESKRNKGRGKENDGERSLAALQGMIDYCVQTTCRRKYLLEHFGEKIDSKVCDKTCDFCKDPAKVEHGIRGAESQAVKHTVERMKSSRSKVSSKSWDGQWDRPHGAEQSDDDEYDDFNEKWGDGAIGITCYDGGDDPTQEPLRKSAGGFVKATKMLDKFEMMECQEGKKNGFVTFKPKQSSFTDIRDKIIASANKAVVIPEHLRANLPDPLESMNKSVSKPAEKSSAGEESGALASKVDQLKAELAKLQEQKAARLAKMNSESSASVVAQKQRTENAPRVPPPPKVSFRSSGKKKSRRN